MFGPPGVAYVYLVYGMHDCLNVVTEPEGRPAAVLIRAVEAEEGIEAMRAAHLERELSRRRTAGDPSARARVAARLAAEAVTRIASGPGRVASAFGLDRSHTGLDLTRADSAVRIEPLNGEPPSIVVGPRIGVAYADEPWASKPWRFAVRDHPAVSNPRPTA
jgi:DNA-3-methyladenine glycosylase